MVSRKFLLFCILQCLLIPGCTARIASEKEDLSKIKGLVEVVTVEQQALESVMSAPTDFMVAHQNDFDFWQRATLFFTFYLGRDIPSSYHLDLLSNRDDKTKDFIFEVRRQSFQDGIRYRVSCIPRMPTQEKVALAERNAKNVARFIQEGTLERSLLVF